MPYRGSIHSIVNMLADYGAFENHTVTMTIVNGTDVNLNIDPPLHPSVAKQVNLSNTVEKIKPTEGLIQWARKLSALVAGFASAKGVGVTMYLLSHHIIQVFRAVS